MKYACHCAKETSGRNICRDQRGMASFLVTLVMMMVITLIVVGFSQVARRNQSEALNNQLSEQAFYAVESGINVTDATISSYLKTNSYGTLPVKSTCNGEYDPNNQINGASTSNLVLSSTPDVQDTCILVNPNPTSLQYNLTTTSSEVIPINSNTALESLTFNWAKQDSTSTLTSCSGSAYEFQPVNVWGSNCDFGVLRLDLVANPTIEPVYGEVRPGPCR